MRSFYQALMRISTHYVAAYKSAPTSASSDCVAAVVMGAIISLTDAVLQLQPTPTMASKASPTDDDKKQKDAKAAPEINIATSLHIVSKLMMGITGDDMAMRGLLLTR